MAEVNKVSKVLEGPPDNISQSREYRGYHLLVKVSINRYLQRRIETARKEIETQTRKIRNKSIQNLEEILNMAARMARGEIQRRRIRGKMTRVTLKQRKRYLRVAEQAAKTIDSIATNLNEKEIYAKLDELERLIDEASPPNKA